MCQILVWWNRKGGGIRGSPEITPELQHKSNTVALTDPSKKTVLPVQLDPEFSMSCWLPRTDSPILTSAAAQRSQQPSTVHKQSYLWRTLHRPRSRRNLTQSANIRANLLLCQNNNSKKWIEINEESLKFAPATCDLEWTSFHSSETKSLVPVQH